MQTSMKPVETATESKAAATTAPLLATALAFALLVSSALADVSFRSSWQGRWVAFGDYYVDIARCSDNLCTLGVWKFGSSKPSFSAKLRLLSYTKAEVADKSCTLLLQTTPKIPSDIGKDAETPYLSVLENSCFARLDSALSYQQNKAYPAFDCTKARSKNELAICQSSDIMLGYYDVLLNDFYHELMKNMSRDKASALQASQKQWLERFGACEGDAECMLRAYKERVEEFGDRYCMECG